MESGAEGGLGVRGSRTAPSNELCLFTKQLTHSPAHTCLSVDSSLALGLCCTLRLRGNYCQQENPYLFYKEWIKVKCRSPNIIVHDVAFFC